MDSWLIDKIWQPDEKVYINMHTRYSEQEIAKIKARNEDVTILDFPLGQYEREDKIIPLRNLYLVMAICNYTGNEDVDICLGATAGDRVLDKSIGFTERVKRVGSVRVVRCKPALCAYLAVPDNHKRVGFYPSVLNVFDKPQN